jgi:hypothetical protein
MFVVFGVFDAPGKLKSFPDRADSDSIGIKSATF